jgi:class 3 adenylate cyclase
MKRIFGFQQIEQFSYSLMGFIPYLLAIYLIIYTKVELSSTILLVAAGALFAHLMGFIIIRRFGKQLKDVRDKTGKAMTAERKLSIEMDENAPHELTSIVHNFNTMLAESERSSRNFQEMTTKLMLYTRDIEGYQKKLREEGMSRYRLSRYVGQDLVNKIISSSGDIPLQNKKLRVTMLFADIRSFTAISEHMAPEQVISMLNEYFDAMVKIIFYHNGILDKFVGDELLATFGVLEGSEQGPLNALNAAIAMQDRIIELMADFVFKGYPTFEIGIGINTGEVVMGNLGSKNRMDYTVIGDTVNVAARLEQMAEGGSIVAGEETYNSCKAYIQMKPRGEVKVKNRAAPVKCFQVIR